MTKWNFHAKKKSFLALLKKTARIRSHVTAARTRMTRFFHEFAKLFKVKLSINLVWYRRLLRSQGIWNLIYFSSSSRKFTLLSSDDTFSWNWNDTFHTAALIYIFEKISNAKSQWQSIKFSFAFCCTRRRIENSLAWIEKRNWKSF